MTSKLKQENITLPEINAKKVLITGARVLTALELARQLRSCGHQVYAADTSTFHALGFSNAIEKMYDVPSPRRDSPSFIDAILDIVKKEKIDLLIPIWEEAYYISRHLDRFPKSCKVFCSPFELLHELHNKWTFIQKLASCGILTPRTELVTSEKELKNILLERPFILKRCYGRGSRDVMKVVQEIPQVSFEKKNPWIAQEFIEGRRYCTYSVCHSGKVLAHSLYEVLYTIDGNSCVAFNAIRHPKIFDWVKNFIHKIQYTGQIAFDIIETASGELYSVDCNPRATSGLHLFKPEDHIDRAFFHQALETIFPKDGNSQQIASGMLAYGLREGIAQKKFLDYATKFLTTKDVIFSSNDLQPFLFEPLIFFSYWIKGRRAGLSIPRYFTWELDWDNELED